jgi:hypothetical protein
MENKEKELTKYDRHKLKDVEAYRKKKREWARTPNQREKRTIYMREWREKNREKHNQQAKESHHRNKYKHIGKMRIYMLKTRYGITEEDYNRIFKEQNGVCKICGKEPYEHAKNKMSKVLHIDHDHETGLVRGLLCSRCNGALGWYQKYRKEINKYIDSNLSIDNNQFKLVL